MNKPIIAIVVTLALHSFAFLALGSPRLNAAPRAHRSAKAQPSIAPPLFVARETSAPKCKGAPVVKVKSTPAKPRVMVCGAPRTLRTSTFQTVRICEYQ